MLRIFKRSDYEPGSTKAVAFTPDGTMVLSGHTNGCAYLWNASGSSAAAAFRRSKVKPDHEIRVQAGNRLKFPVLSSSLSGNVTIIDISGRVIARIDLKRTQGQKYFECGTGGIRQGTYFIRFSDGAIHSEGKLVVVR